MKIKYPITDPIKRSSFLSALKKAEAKYTEISIDELDLEFPPIWTLHLQEIASEGQKCVDFDYVKLENYDEYYINSEDASDLIGKIKDEKTADKDFFHNIDKIILYTHDEDLKGYVSKDIIPAFQKRFPNGSVFLLSVNNKLNIREGIVRYIMSLQKVGDIFNLSEKDFNGFSSLRTFHSAIAAQTIKSYLNNILLVFEPYSYGIYSDKIICFFIFLYGKHFDFRDYFPMRLIDNYSLDFIRAKKYIPTKDLIKDDTLEYILSKMEWDNLQFKELFKQYICRLDKLLEYLYDPSNFLNTSGYIDGFKSFNTIFTVNRIVTETSLIHENYSTQAIRVIFSLAILDKIGNLLKTINNSNDKHYESKIFKKLLDLGESQKLLTIFDKLPSPYNDFLKKQFVAAYSQLYKDVESSIFIKGKVQHGQVIIDPKDATKNITITQYTQDLIRAIRNTHHGYGLYDEHIDNLLISDGSIGNSIEFIAPLLVLLLVIDINEFNNIMK